MNEKELVINANAISKLDEQVQSKNRFIESELDGKVKAIEKYGDVKIIRLKNGNSGVVNNGVFVVPFDKYEWIEGFDNGLCRVRTKGKILNTKNIIGIMGFDKDNPLSISDPIEIEQYVKDDSKKHSDCYAKWGIINENGEAVLPVEYDEVWKFLGKNRFSTTVVKDGVKHEIFFHELNPSLPVRTYKKTRQRNYDYDENCLPGTSFNDFFDSEGNFDQERYEDAILDGEYVPEDW